MNRLPFLGHEKWEAVHSCPGALRRLFTPVLIVQNRVRGGSQMHENGAHAKLLAGALFIPAQLPQGWLPLDYSLPSRAYPYRHVHVCGVSLLGNIVAEKPQGRTHPYSPLSTLFALIPRGVVTAAGQGWGVLLTFGRLVHLHVARRLFQVCLQEGLGYRRLCRHFFAKMAFQSTVPYSSIATSASMCDARTSSIARAASPKTPTTLSRLAKLSVPAPVMVPRALSIWTSSRTWTSRPP